MINFLILFIILLLVAYLTDYLLIRSFLGYTWRFFVAPGVIIHELSHAAACLLTFARIEKISFFDKDGGSVTHESPKIPIIGLIFISMAPLIVGITIFYYLGHFVHLEGSLNFSSMFNNLQSIFKTIDLTNWLNILIIYLMLSIAVTMTPSRQDLMNILTPVLLLTGIIYLLVRFTSLNFIKYEYIFSNLVPVLSLSVMILLICLVFSLILYLITKILFHK